MAKVSDVMTRRNGEPPPVAPQEPRLSGERGVVWVLEDSPLEAEMARRALATFHLVEVFADAHTMLERIANGARPDAIVMDWQLPVMTGIEVCRFLRASFDATALPVLMLTIQSRQQDVVEGLAAGANDYVTKPYDIGELVARVGTLVRTSRLHQVQVRRARQLAAAADIGFVLTHGGTDEEALAKRCCDAVVLHLGAVLAALWICEGDDLRLASAAGPLAALYGRATPVVRVGEGVVGRIAASRERVVGSDIQLLPDGADGENEERSGRAFIGIPLVLDRRTTGVLVVVVPRQHLDAEDPDFITSLGDTIGLGLERVRVDRERAVLFEREQRARAEAEQATRSKDEFLAVVSHELRTPLNAIAGWVQLLRAGTVPPAQTARALETVERNAKAQAQLIEDLVDVSRIVTRKLGLQKRAIDVADCVAAAVESVRPATEKKTITLTLTCAPALPSIMADPDRLRQVVSNLLNNAVKFTPRGGRIDVVVRADGDRLAIVVRDTGTGIAPAFLPHVFERFRQADARSTRAHGGLGLGLAIVRHVVELHGGTVRAESEGEGKGAAFTVELPTTTPASAPSAASLPDAPDSEPAPAQPLQVGERLASRAVLLVEDDADGRDLAASILRQYGARVVAVSSVADALAAVTAERFDVIVSDIGMPDEDGLSLLRRIRTLEDQRGRRTPAVALTAYTRLEDRQIVRAAGFDLHLAKPLNAAELVSAVGRLADRHERSLARTPGSQGS